MVRYAINKIYNNIKLTVKEEMRIYRVVIQTILIFPNEWDHPYKYKMATFLFTSTQNIINTTHNTNQVDIMNDIKLKVNKTLLFLWICSFK